MRKIVSKHEEEKKRKRNTLIVSAVMIFILLASTFGMIVNSFGDKEEVSRVKSTQSLL